MSGHEPRTAPSLPFSLVLLLLAVAVAYIGFAGLDQNLRAARGEGSPGTFAAVSLSCVQHPGHESCVCNGHFTPDGGGEPRGVYLHAAGRETCVEGESVAAVDVGADNRVYGPDGSREWILSALLLLGPLAVAGGIAASWARRRRRWLASGP
ncbi:hypothetical protein ACIBFB_22020 [Nocardiopsis sp. NPDC050513]|uniref:hypothetical protein n=1 Tax=Nocardiopsis sp. NPDC050513 TaxID=3364338 RepID=UPI00379AD4C7